MKKSLSLILVFILILTLFSACGASASGASYEINVQFSDEAKSLTGDMTVHFQNSTSSELDELHFNMFANAYRQNAKFKPVPDSKFTTAFPHGNSYGYIDIISVTAPDGTPLDFEIAGVDKNLLIVKLPKTLKVNQSTSVKIAFSIKLANVLHRLGYSDDVVSIGNAFPMLAVYENGKFVECPYYDIGDPFYSKVANYTVNFKCPSTYVVGASGKAIKSVDGGNFVTTTYKIDNARDFALSLSKGYKVIKGDVDGVEVIYQYQKDKTPNDSFMTASRAMRTYSKLFGKYPYKTLTISETPFIEGGMEFPAHIFVSDSASCTDRTEIIAHEIAHEWWYGIVGNNQVDFAIFDEGLAQYSTLMFFEENASYEITRENRIEKLKRNYNNYIKLENIAYVTSNSKICKPLNEFNTQFEYVFKTYVLGELFFEDLRTTMGDEKFLKSLKDLYREFKFSEISLDDFAKSMSKSSKIDLDSYIKNYLGIA